MTADQLPAEESYALVAREAPEIAAPSLDYRPPMPADRSIPIGLIGAGGISFAHLEAYRRYGLNVVAIADRHLDRAMMRRDQHFPHARATNRVDDLIGNPDIAVLDITLHPEGRAPLMRRALEAGQHVLSQKPFVRSLALGAELADLAAARRLQLAVNQNGRFAPHMAWMRAAVAAGYVGDVTGVHVSIQWDHGWVAGTPFDQIDQLILEDFGIHWFDFLVSIIGDRATSVIARSAQAADQAARAPLLAEALVAFQGGQASLVFDGATKFGARDETVIIGTKGTLRSSGPDLGHQQVSLFTEAGVARPRLEGTWFNDGFAGAMGALLVAIETGEPPIHAARDNLRSLRLGRAAVESALEAGIRIRIDPEE
ncbi:Predicted dehydrogenase [Kaistia soli DSM 19436]|uniref:Predicted dehydrogenase n=1 Tax=Kaistia soli DSM 19436 TaxID=1122133 RepID=A0A1M5IK75_9HYPH|nr:Gfo/Idh/MocA family oxidoreductase [Kaistia soli]SHG28671.1 Predicted dehydrogenase [Kaistia soli DSM 19436]